MRSEEDLVRTMRAAAEQAGGHDLAYGVARRRRARRTRQRMQVLLAAVAVVAVAGGTTAVLSGEGRRAEPAVTVSPPLIKAAGELWPQAIVKVPMRNAKGWKMHPVTSLSATEVLLAPESGFEKGGRLEAYDSASGKTRVLGDVPSPRKGYYLQQFAVGRQYVAWFGETPRNSDKWADFWIIPREGGKARRVGEVAADVESIGLTDDSLVWSVKEGGVHRMPLTGGAPERLPGTDGLHLASWPWANARAGQSPISNVTRVVNLETGRSSDVAIPDGVEMMQCNAQWCVGRRHGLAVVQRVNGSGRRTLPATLLPMDPWWLVGDRYAIFRVYDPKNSRSPGPIAVLYDLATGTMAGLSERTPGVRGGIVRRGSPASSPPNVVIWDADQEYDEVCRNEACTVKARGGGKEYTVLNLAAVPG
ncbi:hypothetical protein ABGB18_34815 [Nonomuraea sp. B12E4]|uniref:hypothetical protein n=1 Tax=Nonomuraea sp. B12E4 TaxID=3153564 RepID=UPI00325F664C